MRIRNVGWGSVVSEAPISNVRKWSDVLLIATSLGAQKEVSFAIQDQVAGKPLIDATIPGGTRSGPLSWDP